MIPYAIWRLEIVLFVRKIYLYHNKYSTLFTGTYSDITDEQLDYYVVRAASEHPRIGIRMIKGYLQSNGLSIQRHRIRSSLMRTDPIGLLERWRNAIKRRCYNVKYPLSLWHKLIRYLSKSNYEH